MFRVHVFALILASNYILAYPIEGDLISLKRVLSKKQFPNLDVSALSDDTTNSLNSHLRPTTEPSQLSNAVDARNSPVSNCDFNQSPFQKRSTVSSGGRGMCSVNGNGFKDVPRNPINKPQNPKTSPSAPSSHQHSNENPCANDEFQIFYAVCTGGRFGNNFNPDYVLGCFHSNYPSSSS